MSDEEGDTIGADSSAPSRVDRDRRAPRFSWTPAYEATFFRSLCESVQLGLRENSSFKAEAWERAAAALQATHGAYPAKSHLINKSDNARKRFRLWRGLREDPEFLYNPVARTVTATEEAWRAHIEREPLSRALRGRPFDHEDFMEILYPDVIGSGGAPKRIMKPKRRTDGTTVEDPDMPGTGVLNLQGAQPTLPTSPSESQRPALSKTPSGSSSGSLPVPQTATVTSQTPATSGSSVLTPPDETAPSASSRNRKRKSGAVAPPTEAIVSPPLAEAVPPTVSASPSQSQKRRRTSSRNEIASSSTPLLNSTLLSSQARDSQPLLPLSLIEELLEALKTHRTPRWREESLDIFFAEFSNEELDLQVKISENVLSNEHKAMVFCKMPESVRQHWVSKFREMHQLNKTS